MDYIFDKSHTQQAEDTYKFMKDHIEKWGFVTLAQVDDFIGSYRLCHSYGFTNNKGWTSMDGIEFGWREHEIVYTNRIGGAFHSGKYHTAMTLTMPEPKEITYKIKIRSHNVAFSFCISRVKYICLYEIL